MKLKEHYDRMWSQSLQKFKNYEFEYDPQIDSANDTRYGITLLARPPGEVKQNICGLLDEIKAVAPNQYYYPNSDLHVTVLSIISCYSGFSHDEIDKSQYRNLIHSVVDSVSPFRIEFSGLTASPSCILIQGFPGDNQLNRLRNHLRKELMQSDLQHSIDKRYHLQTAHMTVVRFKNPFSDSDAFINKITGLRNRNFGSFVIDQLELVGNDWYQRQEKVKLIERFDLE